MIREREGSGGVKLACREDPDGRPGTRRMVDGKEVPSSLWMEEMVRGGDRLTEYYQYGEYIYSHLHSAAVFEPLDSIQRI